MLEFSQLHCEVEWAEPGVLALVTPAVLVRSDRKRHAVCSFDLDGFELLPSCGISIDGGENVVRLPPVRLHGRGGFRRSAVLHVYEDGHPDVECEFFL